MKDYYAILGLQRGASPREIKRAYRKLVRKWHPDFHPNDSTCLKKMQEINEAYGALMDPGRRRGSNQREREWEKALRRRMAVYPTEGDHPFFSYFLRMREMFRKRDKK